MLRLFIALPFAAAIALSLFTFMAWMVDNGHQRAADNEPPLVFDVVMVEEEREAQRRQRSVPEKPKTPQPPAATTLKTNVAQTATPPMPAMPDLSLQGVNQGLAINLPQFSDFGSNQQAMPLYRVEPRYPARALKKGAEGYVLMSFTIDKTGRPTDITVVEAKPRRLFEREAKRALKKWKYQPKVVDGRAIAQIGQTVKLEFKISQ